MSKFIRKVNDYGSNYKYEPIIELLTNDCLYRIDITFIPNPLSNTSSQTRSIKYSNSEKGIANKCTVFIRGNNDFVGNKVDKVYYSINNKLLVSDFDIVTDYGISEVSVLPFGLKSDNGHIYFCSALPDSRAHYKVSTITFDNAEISNGLTNNFKYINWGKTKTRWYSVDKYAIYRHLVPEKETSVFENVSSSHVKFKVSKLERGWISLCGASNGGVPIDRKYVINSIDYIYETKSDNVACVLYKENDDNKTVYIESNATWGNIKLTASGDMRVDLVSDMDFSELTQITPVSLITGTSRPDGGFINKGHVFFDESLNPARPIWYKGNNVWVDATGATV